MNDDDLIKLASALLGKDRTFGAFCWGIGIGIVLGILISVPMLYAMLRMSGFHLWS